ncbi:respiratory chain complex I subunit 1 family protein [Nitratiruptor sp. SB155-2]|uniref:respiratory chain complex I subunit 1 family protein n=1 Tax=Nitratiruptor sp. (strain SB155-2) TaxID=387092 RepID=UPI00015872ED|nr:NADH-quinone oxidoreductase subunit H [Nitratiruptor sp. SB155-2]BAF69832.1 Ni-Fe hydrogenase, membrane subunit HycD/HyfD [Nitratiruptor sp. SB155-2]
MIQYLIFVATLIVTAPLFLTFMKAVKMWLLYKKPVSLLQGYKDFSKLIAKEVIISKEASSITSIAPYMVLAPLVLVLFFLPVPSSNSYYVGFVDAFTITGLITLSTFFLMLLGLDSASSFGGIGSSREAFISALVEPAMVLVIFSLSLIAKDLGVAKAALNLNNHFPIKHLASFTFAAIAFFILLLAENGRIPVDNPETHLELTMVHEAMILDISGFYLALIESASSLKFMIFATLFVSFFLPFGANLPFLFALGLFLIKIAFVSVAVAFIEVNTAKLRLFKVPNLLGIAIIFAFLSLISYYILGA